METCQLVTFAVVELSFVASKAESLRGRDVLPRNYSMRCPEVVRHGEAFSWS